MPRLFLLGLAACADPLVDPTPYLDGPAVLAVAAEPAEAEPGASVALRALTVNEAGIDSSATVDWGFCVDRKPLDALGPVAESCTTLDGEGVLAIGEGTDLLATLPEDGCSLFGPNPPAASEGEPAGRPVDPDTTGGYHQPVLAAHPEAPLAIGAVRLRCGLAAVSQEDYVAWNQAYLNNSNPTIAALTVDGEALGADPVAVAAGASAELTVSWDPCALAPCGGAEPYVRWDGERLVDVREAMSVSWFTTGGQFESARGGVASEDEQTEVSTQLKAPAAGGPLTVIAVLRDDRGGVTWAVGALEILENP